MKIVGDVRERSVIRVEEFVTRGEGGVIVVGGVCVSERGVVLWPLRGGRGGVGAEAAVSRSRSVVVSLVGNVREFPAGVGGFSRFWWRRELVVMVILV